MFAPTNAKIIKLAKISSLAGEVTRLEKLLKGNVNVYIDYANVRPWSEKLKWHLSISRTKQFLDSFKNIKSIKWYQGELVGDIHSQGEIKKIQKWKYTLRTKPVKIMKLSIDATSISRQSPDLLKKFLRKSLLRKYDIATIEFLNQKFADMNAAGIFEIEDRKCNFDVEIGADMRVDNLTTKVDTFVLWSGDSDFADPLKNLLDEGKNVILFATAGRISKELNLLRKHGLIIVDVFHLRDFLCWSNEQVNKISLP